MGFLLREDQARQIAMLESRIGWKGARVLEIGGDLDGQVANTILSLGSKSVIAINHDDAFDHVKEAEGLTRLKMDARNLEFPANHFDIVLGMAVLEHLRELDVVLRNVRRVLRPNGHAFFHGGPLWNSYFGHHLVLDAPSGRQFRFWGPDCPIENWDHLLLEPQQMQAKLLSQGCEQADCKAIVDYVYGSDLINRYSSDVILGHIKNNNFRILDLKVQQRKESELTPDISQKLSDKLGLPRSEFLTSSVEILLKNS